MRFLWLLLLPAVCPAKTIELGFPDLAYRVKVTLPDNHDPAKKYPAIFYYHGMGGKPDTSLMRSHVDGREWIVVGMTYFQQGRFTYSPQALEKELVLLRSVRRNLAEKRGLDQRRCYVAGFSKGGWMVDLLLQADPNLAGGVILGGGHLYKAKPLGRSRLTSKGRKPVFIGVGRLDPNYPFSLRAVIHHRSAGSSTTFEAWQGLGHSFPREGSTALQQWFVTRCYPAVELKSIAQKEMNAELKEAEGLEDYPRWVKLRQLKDYPYSRMLGETWLKSLSEEIGALELKEPVKTEAAFLLRHRKLLAQEIKEKTVSGMAKINTAYQDLILRAPHAQQAAVAKHDHKRTQQLYLQYKQQDAAAREKRPEKERDGPFAPKDPERKRPIPVNPLVR